MLILICPKSACAVLAELLGSRWCLAVIICEETPEDVRSAAKLAISALPPSIPLHFLAVGAAGTLAYEMVSILRAKGRDVPYFVIVGSPAPRVGGRGGWLRRLLPRKKRDIYEARPLHGACGLILTLEVDEASTDRWFRLLPPISRVEPTRRTLDHLLGTRSYELGRLIAKFDNV